MYGARVFSANELSQRSVAMLSSGNMYEPPALFTTMSTRP